ncbi:DUF1223 domain-containing protein [Hellea balneolensis]|uniref:DUF1223 domain-containing protein n=1 Tax=Hellea balneolensis TaxID=287478 RepID=UPI0004253BFF|nr:DUF1223 domain-containing protein [Hellea balneolensis]
MKKLLLIPFALFLTTSAFAGDSTQPNSVVELFTSQGCSSCPPANKFVGKLADEGDKLVLSYGVTYWDYLGWKDTFGDPKFTQRQREYGKALGAANVYTPQIVLNGSAHSPRYSRKDVNTMPLPDTKPTAFITSGDKGLIVTADAEANAKLVIVSYMPGEQAVPVKRGENGGRTLKISNVVTDVTPVNWNGGVSRTKIMPQKGQAYAALFHDYETAKIITAAVYLP